VLHADPPQSLERASSESLLTGRSTICRMHKPWAAWWHLSTIARHYGLSYLHLSAHPNQAIRPTPQCLRGNSRCLFLSFLSFYPPPPARSNILTHSLSWKASFSGLSFLSVFSHVQIILEDRRVPTVISSPHEGTWEAGLG